MLASNELMFVNSLKMKLSVILGVSHMVLGIILKGLNALFECDLIELLFIFFPEIILMLILFGYMDFLIFVKWSIDYKDKESRAPDIKSFLMSIVLKFGELPSTGIEGEDWIFYTDRATLEKINRYILFGAAICIILMLFPKMILKYFIAKNKYKKKNLKDIKNIAIINEDEEGNNIKEGLIDDKNDENTNKALENQEPIFSDFMVASIIETIEFVLGTVSNTASYLRLWALSLAHS
jgi:V-type H+-transporting ATPase subunit a